MKTSTLKSLLAGLGLLILCSFMGPWVEYKTPDGKSSIKFPSTPVESSQEIPSAIGNLVMKMVMHEAVEGGEDPNLNYGFIYTDYPDTLINSDFGKENIDAFFESSINGAVTNVEGKLISTETNEIQGFPGRRIKIDYGNGQAIIDMQMYLVKNRTYFIQVIHTTDNKDNIAAEQFVGSFKLLN